MTIRPNRVVSGKVTVTMRKAFTLIELLVVVSIIALLIAILLPALGKAREAAKTAVCQANLNSIGQAQYAYVADNKGQYTIANQWVWGKDRYPDGSPVPAGPGGVGQQFDPTVKKNIEQGTLYSYHGVLEAFVCPVAVDKLPRQAWWSNEKFVRSYVQNAEAGPSASTEWKVKGWTEEESLETLSRPSDFVLFNEENTFAISGWNSFNSRGMNDAMFRLQPFDYDTFGSFHGTGSELGAPVTGTYYSQDDPLCSGVSYAVMADGHVEEVNYKGRISGGPFNRTRWSRMWSKDAVPVEQ